jgi:hypothetical protein
MKTTLLALTPHLPIRTSPERGSARNSDPFHRFARCFRIGLTENEKRDPIDFLSVL